MRGIRWFVILCLVILSYTFGKHYNIFYNNQVKMQNSLHSSSYRDIFSNKVTLTHVNHSKITLDPLIRNISPVTVKNDAVKLHFSGYSTRQLQENTSHPSGTISVAGNRANKITQLKIYTSPIGRIGNRLFQIASTYGIARMLNRKLVISSDALNTEIVNIFNINESIETIPHHTHLVMEKGYGTFDPSVYNHLPKRDVRIALYLQSWKYFWHCKTDIKGMFSFRSQNDVAKRARDKLKHIIRKHKKLRNTTVTPQIVAIHVRLGDSYDAIPEKSFFIKAMRFFRTRLGPDVLFIVVSDGKNQCRRLMKNLDVHVVGGSDKYVDLAIMSFAHGTIISRYSTFAWWGAFLSGKLVVYNRSSVPTDQPEFTLDDNIPRTWIPIKE